VIFNENQFFSGDIQQLRDDLLYITTEELEALLHSIEIQTEPLESGSTNHFEDDELYIAVREVIPDEQTEGTLGSSDTQITQIEDTRIDEALSPDQTNPYEVTRSLLTPDYTPIRPGALLAIAIRNAGHYQEEEAEDQLLVDQAQGEVQREVYTNLCTNPCSSNTKYRT
jgi:hypothetical protein